MQSTYVASTEYLIKVQNLIGSIKQFNQLSEQLNAPFSKFVSDMQFGAVHLFGRLELSDDSQNEPIEFHEQKNRESFKKEYGGLDVFVTVHPRLKSIVEIIVASARELAWNPNLKPKEKNCLFFVVSISEMYLKGTLTTELIGWYLIDIELKLNKK